MYQDFSNYPGQNRTEFYAFLPKITADAKDKQLTDELRSVFSAGFWRERYRQNP